MIQPQPIPQVPAIRHIRFTSFDFSEDGSITETFAMTHALDLSTPKSLMACFERFAYILGVSMEGIDEDLEDVTNESNSLSKELKNSVFEINKKVDDSDNLKKFMKQMSENSEFAKRVFKFF